MTQLSEYIYQIIRHYVYITCFAMLFCSCSDKSSIEIALERSEGNRSNLEPVISYYQEKSDTQALLSSKYLIENMIGKYSCSLEDTANVNNLLHYIATINDSIGWDASKSTLYNTIDSVLFVNPVQYTISEDLQTIGAQMLISNIDSATNVWNNVKWNNGEYTFEEFCDYVLPYKISVESIEDWRMLCRRSITSKEDSITDTGNIRSLTIYLINNMELQFNIGMNKYPYPLNYSSMNYALKGMCNQMAIQILFTLRSRGIPSSIDFTPSWANRNGAHVWNTIILPKGDFKPIGYNSNAECLLSYKISKVYRRMYRNMVFPEITQHEKIPTVFLNSNIKDVTGEYDMVTYNTDVDLLVDMPVNLVYLATFDNFNWNPVAYSQVKGSKATFKDLGCGILPLDCDNQIKYRDQGNGIVYLPLYSLKNGYIPAAPAFVLDSLGKTIPLVASDKKEVVVLGRKYPKLEVMFDYEQSLISGRFEGSNDSTFGSAEVLFVVDSLSRYPLERVSVEPSSAYRYYRFVGASSVDDIFLSEVIFWGEDGGVISGVPLHGSKAFDGQLLTYSGSQDGFVVDFGEAVLVDGLGYASRNDDNGVVAGEHYELFYWDNRWVSLGERLADAPYLEYEVPVGALFWLRNLSKGVEQRIFTIEDGRQIWW